MEFNSTDFDINKTNNFTARAKKIAIPNADKIKNKKNENETVNYI